MQFAEPLPNLQSRSLWFKHRLALHKNPTWKHALWHCDLDSLQVTLQAAATFDSWWADPRPPGDGAPIPFANAGGGMPWGGFSVGLGGAEAPQPELQQRRTAARASAHSAEAAQRLQLQLQGRPAPVASAHKARSKALPSSASSWTMSMSCSADKG